VAPGGGHLLNRSGRPYMSNGGLVKTRIVEYAPGAGENMLPAAIIAGLATQLQYPEAVSLIPAGKIYAANGYRGRTTAFLNLPSGEPQRGPNRRFRWRKKTLTVHTI
jgi:hypothetical protein